MAYRRRSKRRRSRSRRRKLKTASGRSPGRVGFRLS